MIKVRTYVIAVFGSEPLSAYAPRAGPLVQLSNTSLQWFIVKYHNAVGSRYNIVSF